MSQMHVQHIRYPKLLVKFTRRTYDAGVYIGIPVDAAAISCRVISEISER